MNDSLNQIDGKFYQKCNVVMLPTEKESCLFQTVDEKLHHAITDLDLRTKITGRYYHLYFLSNEEIKEDDIAMNLFNNTHSIFKITKILSDGYEATKYVDGKFEDFRFYGLGMTLKKVIATTDNSITKQIFSSDNNKLMAESNYPRPSNDFINVFIKKYNKGNQISKVLVEVYNDCILCNNTGHVEYKICSLCNNQRPFIKIAPDNTIIIKPFQEITYTKKEVIELFQKYHKAFSPKRKPFADVLLMQMDNWLQENIKK